MPEYTLTAYLTLADVGGSANNLASAMIVEGEIPRLRDLIHSDWYRDTIIKARHLVDNINEVHCVTDETRRGSRKVGRRAPHYRVTPTMRSWNSVVGFLTDWEGLRQMAA